MPGRRGGQCYKEEMKEGPLKLLQKDVLLSPTDTPSAVGDPDK